MINSFQKLWEDSRDNWYPAQTDEQGKNAMDVIHRGMEMRPDRADGATFWDDFMSIAGSNSQGLSDLLGVGQDVVNSWSGKIRKGLESAKNKPDDKKTKMLSTGIDNQAEQ